LIVIFRKPKLVTVIKKKKECEKKALNIVVELIDGGLEENVLLHKVKYKYYFQHK